MFEQLEKIYKTQYNSDTEDYHKEFGLINFRRFIEHENNLPIGYNWLHYLTQIIIFTQNF